MTFEVIVTGISSAVLLIAIALLVLRKRPRKINCSDCSRRWQELQKHCADRKTWHLAVTDADRLLDDVLKRRKYKGKTTGERLVSAQHDFSNNESLWFGHKLYNKIIDENHKKLSKQDTLEALSGFRTALKDLGALPEKPLLQPQEAEKTES